MIYIVGLGPGNKDYILKKAEEILKGSDLIIGFDRAIESLDFINNKKVKVNKLKEIIEIAENYDYKSNLAIVASGDPMFYGISNYINNNCTKEIEVIPGISSFQYLMCNINKPWNNAHTGSLHGREEDFINKVNQNEVSIWLCDNKNTPSLLCEKLVNNNINCLVTVGENLSYEDERIVTDCPEVLRDIEFNNLSIIVIERKL
ncbi:MAG: precorrin-6y C5,15-methyltransferase (decarboxylating) subunit CbiE [Clostridium sp.]|uniref:precorrin-6y C5,15-methyltransferase (decarboxylating) subunit CbiE n=1 Tax=Clostridium sp. TaxID=1506 RepID=UPI003F2CA977